jgi:hypothetical protein
MDIGGLPRFQRYARPGRAGSVDPPLHDSLQGQESAKRRRRADGAVPTRVSYYLFSSLSPTGLNSARYAVASFLFIDSSSVMNSAYATERVFFA